MIAQRIGPYEITARLGEGGMGVVYRARDTRLGRDVALKVLPDLFAADPERLARFDREARTLAALNHPHIAQVYGVEQAGSTSAIVMEMVDGDDLADRIARGLLPLDEALAMARQIADALGAAHDKGIVHRDLKPANVKITAEGDVKVLDFGLAKAFDAGDSTGAGAAAAISPTITSPAVTQRGVILGTAFYMSPEQARGKPVDARADLWAFGCVLFEMLSGVRPFGPAAAPPSPGVEPPEEGPAIVDVLGAVIHKEPAWDALPASTPAMVRTVLRWCLTKDPRQRIRDARAVQLALAGPFDVPAAPAPAPALALPPAPSRTRTAAIAGAAALVAVAGTAAWFSFAEDAPLQGVTRFAITTSGDAALSLLATDSPLALSPDGSRIAYVGHNASAFFVRALDQLEPTRVGGSVDSRSPFFSPDSQWIAFFEGVERELKRMPASGGPAVRICAVDGERQGGAWTRDGTIVFATGNTATGLWRVNSAGSEPQMLTKPNREAGEADHVFPHAVPGRQQVLFTITPASGNLDEARIALLDLSTGAHQVVLRGGFDARYAASGHLVYATTSGLLAVPFDLDRLASTGVPVAASPPVGTTRTGAAYFDVAANGTLVYVPDAPSPEGDRILVWVDRAGRVEPIPSTPRGYLAVRLSPDGSRVASETVAASRAQLADRDIWIHDLARGTERRLTLDLGVDLSPIWSPDSTRVLFASNRGDTGTGKGGTPGPTPLAIYSQAADGSGRAERMVDEPGRAAEPIGVSPDNAWLLFRVGTGAGTGGRLMIRSLAPPRQPRPLVESSNDLAAIRGGALSPDGRWLVYEEVERNVAQLFVTPFPDVSGGRWQVSTDSGRTPRWSRDGRELFYLASRGRDQNLDTMMAVPVIPGAVWSTGAPVALFDRSVVSGTFDVAPDGERFLMLDGGREADGQPTPRTLVVVERWTEELKVKAPPGSR